MLWPRLNLHQLFLWVVLKWHELDVSGEYRWIMLGGLFLVAALFLKTILIAVSDCLIG